MATKNEKPKKLVELEIENRELKQANLKLQQKVLKNKLKLETSKVKYKKILEYLNLANRELDDLDKNLKFSKVSIYNDENNRFYLNQNGVMSEIKSSCDCSGIVGNQNPQNLILSIVDRIDLAIMIAQKDSFTAVFCNKLAEEIFGNVLGLNILDIKNVNFAKVKALDTLKSITFEYQHNITEESYEIEVKSIKWFNKDSYFITAKNITSIKSYQNNLIELNEILKKENLEKQYLLIQQSKMASMGEMISIIAHQWKQPLNVINLNAQYLAIQSETEGVDKETIHKFVEKIIYQTNFMSNTIDDFKNFFKPSREKNNFSIKTCIEDVLNLLNQQFLNNSITVLIKIDSSVDDTLYGHHNEMTQVFLNIINNAKEAIISKLQNCAVEDIMKGEIEIFLTKKDNNLIIEIKDNGGGIKEELIQNLFKPYFTTKGEKGTGIGLYMAKTIIEQRFLGTIKASNWEGGAVFTITIPKAENLAI